MATDPNQYRLVTFDPGGTTGWAYFIIDQRAFSRPEHKVLAYVRGWNCGEFTGPEHRQLEACALLLKNARWGPLPFVPRMDVVSEKFDLVQTVGGHNLLSPVRINAVLDWLCYQNGLPLNLQARQMRTGVTKERLQLYGFSNPLNSKGRWSTTGNGKDAFAAMQHAIVWLRSLKAESRKRPWKMSDQSSTNAWWDCACDDGYECDLTHPR